jgi:hypothetical protein
MLLFSNTILAKDKINLEGRLLKEYYTSKKDLNRPPGIFVKIFSWRSKKGEHCLTYRTPIKKRKGTLYLLDSKECQLSKSNMTEFKKDILNLVVEKNDTDIILNINKEQVIFSFPYNSNFKYIKLEKQKIKKIETGKLCRQFTSNCLEKTINECHRCEGNIWTAEINWHCARETERRCGNSRCGHKNESACVKFLPQEKSISCFDASKYVYCKSGLSHFCEGDGRIICR